MRQFWRKHRRHAVGALCAAVAAGGAGAVLVHQPSHSGPQTGFQRPDPALTPGVTDPRVTQADISTTICVSGYSATVRPPVSVTGPWKLQSMSQYHRAGSPADYEYDHLIPIEDGGAPADQRNLWPQPLTEAKVKDQAENQAHTDICTGHKTLAQAQQDLLSQWGPISGGQ